VDGFAFAPQNCLWTPSCWTGLIVIIENRSRTTCSDFCLIKPELVTRNSECVIPSLEFYSESQVPSSGFMNQRPGTDKGSTVYNLCRLQPDPFCKRWLHHFKGIEITLPVFSSYVVPTYYEESSNLLEQGFCQQFTVSGDPKPIRLFLTLCFRSS